MKSTALQTKIGNDLSYPSHKHISNYPHVLERHTNDWISNYDCLSMGLREKAMLAKYGVLTADIMPLASLAVLIPTARWMLWAFLFDDFYGPYPKDELKTICARTLAILKSGKPEPGDNVFFKELFIIRKSLEEVSSPQWMARFVDSHAYYFEGLIMDTFSFQETPAYPSSEQYLSIRDRLIGREMICDFLELAGQIFPDDLIQHPKIQRLRELVGRMMIWDNDIFSWQKELSEGDAMNIVLIMMEEKKLSVTEALEEVKKIRKNDYAELINFKALIPEFGTTQAPVVFEYYHNSLILLKGQLDWYQKISCRYQ